MLSDLISKIRYAALRARLSRLPEENRRAAGRDIYDMAYRSVCHEKGDINGACFVLFDCPYDGHISYAVERVLRDRVDDPGDATDYYEIYRDEDDSWALLIVADSSTVDGAMATADASAMSAILSAPTTAGDFHRLALAIADSEEEDDPETIGARALAAFYLNGHVPDTLVSISRSTDPAVEKEVKQDTGSIFISPEDVKNAMGKIVSTEFSKRRTTGSFAPLVI